MSSEEMKECPFCGGPARIRIFEAGTLDDRKGYMPECADECCADDVVYENEGGEAAAIAAWNQRDKADELEALRKQVVRLRAMARDAYNEFGRMIAVTGDAPGVPIFDTILERYELISRDL